MAGAHDIPAAKRDAALLVWIQQFAPYGVFTLDQEFRVQTWNSWMESHTGRPFAEVSSRNLFELYPDLQERRLQAHFQRALEGESSVLSTGLHHYLLALPSPFREFGLSEMQQTARLAPLYMDGVVCGIVVVIEDVTQREGQAAALRQQHRRDETLAWTLTHLLKTEEPQKAARQLFFKVAKHLDFDAFFLYLRHPQTDALFLTTDGGVPTQVESDFEHCPFQAVVPPDSLETTIIDNITRRPEPAFAPLQKAGLAAAVILPLIGKDKSLGLLCFASSSRATIRPEEAELLTTIAQCLATALDREHARSLLQEAKEELGNHALLLEKTVRDRTARLQETVAELETFSYALAHDLREPVRGLTGYCEVLLEDFGQDLTAEAKDVVIRLGRAARRLESLTRDLLAFSRVSVEKIALTPVQVGPILEDVFAMRAPEVREASTVKEPLHPVRAHAALLQQAIANLVDNAVKFVVPGQKPRITIWTQKVGEISPNTRTRALSFSSIESIRTGDAPAPDTADRVRIWVADQGIGIPREVHPKIFGIFERAVTIEQYEGTGIGLAIVARALQRMGGTCGVESEPGQGSRFWLELPAA